MTKKCPLFVFVGESSGDLHGAKVVQAIRERLPHLEICGVAGPRMRALGVHSILPMEAFQVMGFIDVLWALPRLISHFFTLRRYILAHKPDIVLFIDYPGFSLALEKNLYKSKFSGKICHYICPSVWAWGKKRVQTMEKILDQLFVLFPFESSLFNLEKLQVDYVGHPLVEEIAKDVSRPLQLDPRKRLLALFPGSREKELHRNLPIQIGVAKKMLENFPDLTIAISVNKPIFSPLIEQIVKKIDFPFKERLILVSSDHNRQLMKRASFAIAKSGTNNLELALHGVPTIVTYGIHPIDLFIARKIFKINLPFYCIVNIIAGKEIFPELIGPHLTQQALYNASLSLFSSETKLQICREKCVEIGKILGGISPNIAIAEKLGSWLLDAGTSVQNLR